MIPAKFLGLTARALIDVIAGGPCKNPRVHPFIEIAVAIDEIRWRGNGEKDICRQIIDPTLGVNPAKVKCSIWEY